MGFWSDFKREYRREARHRRPWFAAVLNFFAWGLGYLYIGRRRLLGFALFSFVFILFAAGGILSQASVTVNTYSPIAYESFYLAVGMLLAAWFFVSVALARDAYLEANIRVKEKNTHSTPSARKNEFGEGDHRG